MLSLPSTTDTRIETNFAFCTVQTRRDFDRFRSPTSARPSPRSRKTTQRIECTRWIIKVASSMFTLSVVTWSLLLLFFSPTFFNQVTFRITARTFLTWPKQTARRDEPPSGNSSTVPLKCIRSTTSGPKVGISSCIECWKTNDYCTATINATIVSRCLARTLFARTSANTRWSMTSWWHILCAPNHADCSDRENTERARSSRQIQWFAKLLTRLTVIEFVTTELSAKPPLPSGQGSSVLCPIHIILIRFSKNLPFIAAHQLFHFMFVFDLMLNSFAVAFPSVADRVWFCAAVPKCVFEDCVCTAKWLLWFCSIKRSLYFWGFARLCFTGLIFINQSHGRYFSMFCLTCSKIMSLRSFRFWSTVFLFEFTFFCEWYHFWRSMITCKNVLDSFYHISSFHYNQPFDKKIFILKFVRFPFFASFKKKTTTTNQTKFTCNHNCLY